jgi:hypothetical protein
LDQDLLSINHIDFISKTLLAALIIVCMRPPHDAVLAQFKQESVLTDVNQTLLYLEATIAFSDLVMKRYRENPAR